MLEIPESITIAKQLNETVKGKTIMHAEANHTPHKFAWYFGDPDRYGEMLSGRSIDSTVSIGGMIEICLGDVRLVVGDGANLRYFDPDKMPPKKHQLKITFDDDTELYSIVQMYGGIWAFYDGINDNPYYLAAKNAVSPLCDNFDENYFSKLLQTKKSISAKGFLATEQRIPGLGNGVVQDILWNAKIHPKRKTDTFTDDETEKLFTSVKNTLNTMVIKGGRDTEKDLFGNNGGYKTIVSKNTVGTLCPSCGNVIVKENYMGGSIYYCPECQVI